MTLIVKGPVGWMISASKFRESRGFTGVGKDHSNVDRPVHVSPVWNGLGLLAKKLVNVPVRLLARLGAVGDAFAGAAFL